MHKEFTILEDIVVHSVPDGIKTTLLKGKTGIISQSLGDNYTVIVGGNMYQLSGIHGEKIGEEKKEVNSNNFANEEEVWNVLHTCYDPEIPVNLYDLGLIYKVDIDIYNNILIEMTLTNPNCPVAGLMPQSVGKAVEKINNLSSIKVSLVWEPKWHKDFMSEEAKLALDIF